MPAMWIIFQRELGGLFSSAVAYLIAFAFLILTAIQFNFDLVDSVSRKPVEPALIPAFLASAMILFAPLLTMRMLSEESREGRLELLLTAPVRDSDIVVGKFLAVWFYYSLLLLATLIYQIILVQITMPDLGHTASAYIGIWLYGGATLGVGLMFSSVTNNQIVAGFLGTSALLILSLGDVIGEVVADIELARVLRRLTLQGHFTSSFAYGLVRVEDIAYYAGIIVVTLFITIRVVESHRWR